MAGIPGQPTPKPSNVKSPVPGNDPFAELDAIDPSAYAELDALDAGAAQAQEANVVPEEQSGLMQGLDYAGRAADYAGGFIRAGLANSAGLVQGRTDIVNEADLAAAAKGKGPGSAEYLKRMGVPKGTEFNIGGFNFNTRDLGGLGLDLATDPLTALTKITKEIPYISKILNGTSKGTEALGEAVYKAAVGNAERKLIKKGKIPEGAAPLGEALIEAGAPIGNAAKLEKKIMEVSDTMGKTRQALYDKAAELGVSIDMSYPLKRAEGVIKDMRSNPTLVGLADEFQSHVDLFKSVGKASIDQVSKWKSQLYDKLPKNAYGEYGKLNNPGKQFTAALAQDMKDAVVGAGNAAEKGLGDAIDKLNSKWGPLLDAIQNGYLAPQGVNTFGKEITKAVIAQGKVAPIVIKKGLDLATTPAALSTIGKAAMMAGRSGIPDAVARQTLIKATGGRPTEE